MDARAAPDSPTTVSFRARSFPFAKVSLVNRYTPHNIQGYLSHPRDENGVPMRLNGTERFYSPTGVAWAGVEMLGFYLRDGNRKALAISLACADKLRELLAAAGNTGWLPWSVPNFENRLNPPWYNALSQGVALALFSRLYQLEHNADDLATATLLFSTFRHIGPREGPWVGQVNRGGYLWFEHFAGGYHEHVLNAHLWATFGLYDYWLVAPSQESLMYLEGGVTTARDKAHLFRRPGKISWYCLIHKTARAHYQGFHVQELRALAIVTKTPYFAVLANQLHSDYP